MAALWEGKQLSEACLWPRWLASPFSPDASILGVANPLERARSMEDHRVARLARPLVRSLLHGLGSLCGLCLGVWLACECIHVSERADEKSRHATRDAENP